MGRSDVWIRPEKLNLDSYQLCPHTQGLPVVDLNCAQSNCLQVSSTVYTEMHILLQFPKPFHTPLFCLEKALTLAIRVACVCVCMCMCVHASRMLLATCQVPFHSPTQWSFSCRDWKATFPVGCVLELSVSELKSQHVTVHICIHGHSLTVKGVTVCFLKYCSHFITGQSSYTNSCCVFKTLRPLFFNSRVDPKYAILTFREIVNCPAKKNKHEVNIEYFTYSEKADWKKIW